MPQVDGLDFANDPTAPATRDRSLANPAFTKRLEGKRGRAYWQSLEELADTKEFRAMMRRNFPQSAATFIDSMSRRRFLKLMGASLALSGVSGCSTKPTETIVPYVEQPEQLILGRALYYATAMTMGGAVNGLLVEQHEGRPTKIEGNPRHPNSLGATSIHAQASILSMYDPDRSQTVKNQGRISTFDNFTAVFRGELDRLRAARGRGFRVLTESVVSPTIQAQLEEMLRALPEARIHQYEPAGSDNARVGAQLAFGQPVNPVYRFDRAEIVLSLDADFLYGLPHNTRYIRDWAIRRRPSSGQPMSRLYVAESTMTSTGAKADHRMPMLARQVEGLARLVAGRLNVEAGQPAPFARPQLEPRVLEALVADLQGARGRSIVIAGLAQPPAVHALAHAINEQLGNVGQTVSYTAPIEFQPADQNRSLRELVADMSQARVDTLLILGGNPVYTAPADLDFAAALSRVRLSAHLSPYEDETSQRATWHIPQTHYLEAWGDARTFDGTASLVQPLIDPLYTGSRSPVEVLSVFGSQTGQSGLDIVRAYWLRQRGSRDFDRFWTTALHDGVVDGSHFPPVNPRVQPGLGARLPQPAEPADGLEASFLPDPALYDGSWANNGWLQELPKPISKLTWDNAVLINEVTARELGLELEDAVRVELGGRSVRGTVLPLPGQPRGTVTLHLGHGRTAAGRVGNDTGFDAYALRTSQQPWIAAGLRLTKLNERQRLAHTQNHFVIEGGRNRDHIRWASIQEYREHPEVIEEQSAFHGEGASLYPEYDYSDDAEPEGPNSPILNSHHYKWGMAIDMSTCTGCNACIVACQAENNSPVVGKDEVMLGREMQWLRIDTYFTGDADDPHAYFQPMMCVHCEKAPCELVCPVEATVHSIEGLNDMVYNRCVGTKYCSNNCPYKVRRFNFYQYQDKNTPSLRLMRNPDVTVRERGVMEKCTYCTQRISQARINAEREERAVGGDEILTACQAACPADAIVFGDLNRRESRVAKLHREARAYLTLEQLNTQPRTAHLAALRNPNPQIEPVTPQETEDTHG